MKHTSDRNAIIALIVVLVTALIVYFTYPAVMALGEEQYVQVTAEVKANCTNSDLMYTEECVKRFTDDVAESFVDLKKAENVLQEAQTLYNTAFEAHEASVERLNTLTNGI